MLQLSLSQIAAAVGGKIVGGQVRAPGPGHSAADDSLSIKISDSGDDVVVHSFAGDDPLVCRDYVRAKLGMGAWQPKKRMNGSGRSVDDEITDALSATPPTAKVVTLPTSKTLVVRYDYTLINGELQYQVERWQPKNFTQRRPDGDGRWIYKNVFDGVTRVPYLWPQLVAEMAKYPDAPIFVTEGEKDCENVRKLQLTATCVAGGVWTDEIAAVLKGREVIILEDNDNAGRQKSAKAAQVLHGVAASVRIVQFNDLPEGKNDLTDWIELDPEKHNADALIDRCRGVPIWEPAVGEQPEGAPAAAPLFLTLDQWRERDLPAPDYLLGEVFSTTNRAIMSATTGLGKTNFALGIGMRMAASRNFLHWKGRRPAKVLYIDGEMSRRLLKQRLLAEETRLFNEIEGEGLELTGFHALSTEDIPNFQPLNTPQGRAAIEKIVAEIGGCDFVIFDNVMSLIAGSMVDEEAWAQTLPWLKSLTRRCIGQLWVHHTGHDETKGYGTKTREWQMDVVIHLSSVERDDTDVSFKLEFRKARERRPDNRDDFEAVNISLVNGRWDSDAVLKSQHGKASPTAMKYLDALKNVMAGGEQPKSKRLHGRHAVHNDDWKAECELLGLLDAEGSKNNQRAKFSKYRTELVIANLAACEGVYTWII